MFKCGACYDRGFWYDEDTGVMVHCSCAASPKNKEPEKPKEPEFPIPDLEIDFYD